MSGSRKLYKTVFSVTGVILLAKGAGFIKQMLTAGLFGATVETDLITLSQNFTGDLQYVLVQMMLTAFTSLYIREQEESDAHARQFCLDTLNLFSLVAAGLSVLVALLAPLIARIIAPSYSESLSARLSGYIRLYAPLLILFVWMAVFQAALNARAHFLPGELTALNQSILYVLICLAFHQSLGVLALPLSFFAQAIWNTLFLGIGARKYWGGRLRNPLSNPRVHELLRMMLPMLLGSSMVYINQQVDKILASGLGDGVITAMGYGSTITSLMGTVIISMCSIFFTYVTLWISKANYSNAALLTVRVTGILIVIFFPISLLFILCAEDIISLIFGWGAFQAEAVTQAAHAMRGYAFSLVPLVLREVFSRLQYGYQDTRHPAVSSSLGIVANIVLSIALSPIFGVFGITLASSVSVMVCGGLNMYFSKKQCPSLRYLELLKLFPTLVLGGLLCVAGCLLGGRLFQTQPTFVRLALSCMLGGCGYLAAISPLIWNILHGGGLAAFLSGQTKPPHQAQD